MTASLGPFQMWADAHVFFTHLRAEVPNADGPLAERGEEWRHRLSESVNGRLLVRNGMFDALQAGRKLYLMHVTHALDAIYECGVIYPSGGCLVGSVYCAPLSWSADGFRMHNLAEYVLTKEAPLVTQRLGDAVGRPTPLIIELMVPAEGYRGLAGIDYLRLGTVHLEIYLQLEYLLSRAERSRLRETIGRRIRNTTAFLSLCSGLLHNEAIAGPDAFLGMLDEAIPRLPILGYLYFETLAEYLMLHSTTDRTVRLRDHGEFNNWLYKDMLFRAFPRMAGRFDLSKFRPSPRRLAQLLRRADPSVDIEHATRYVMERVSYLVGARLFSAALRPEDWHRARWEFADLCKVAGPLIGHLIHRELRSYGRYPDFYFYFDQVKALQAWNYWNHMGIVAPFNGTIPKGEIGINPAYPDAKYEIYRAELDEDGLLQRGERMPVTISPRLVDINYALLRRRAQPATRTAERTRSAM